MKSQKQKIEQSQSTEIQTEASPLTIQAKSQALLHRTCKTLPLFAFIECYCNNQFHFLNISGTPTEEELQDAWSEIVFEYGGLIKSGNNKYMFDLEQKIGLLQHHIIYVENAIFYLRHRYDADIAAELVGMGYKLTELESPRYDKQLDMIVSRSKTRIFELGELTDEHERLNKMVGGKKQTEEEFLITVAALSKYQGYNINKRETSVLEFTSILNLYLAESKSTE